MQAAIRKSWPARLSALGFIAVIVFGNVWLTFGLTHTPIPQWLGVAMAISIGVTLTGGVCLMSLITYRKFRPLAEAPEEHDAP